MYELLCTFLNGIKVAEVLHMIFFSPDNRYPTVEELVMCDLFRNIDLRELRGPSVSVCLLLILYSKRYVYQRRRVIDANIYYLHAFIIHFMLSKHSHSSMA